MIQVYVDLCRIEVPVVVIIPAAVFRVCNKDPGSGVEGGTGELGGVVAAFERTSGLVIPLYRVGWDGEEGGAGDPGG